MQGEASGSLGMVLCTYIPPLYWVGCSGGPGVGKEVGRGYLGYKMAGLAGLAVQTCLELSQFEHSESYVQENTSVLDRLNLPRSLLSFPEFH